MGRRKGLGLLKSSRWNVSSLSRASVLVFSIMNSPGCWGGVLVGGCSGWWPSGRHNLLLTGTAGNILCLLKWQATCFVHSSFFCLFCLGFVLLCCWEWYLETKSWVIIVLIDTEVSLLLAVLRGYSWGCVDSRISAHTHLCLCLCLFSVHVLKEIHQPILIPPTPIQHQRMFF